MSLLCYVKHTWSPWKRKETDQERECLRCGLIQQRRIFVDCRHGHDWGKWERNFKTSSFQFRFCKTCNIKQENLIG